MAKKKKTRAQINHEGTLKRAPQQRITIANQKYVFPFGAYGSNGPEPLKEYGGTTPQELSASRWQRFDPAASGIFIPVQQGRADGVPVLAIGDGKIVKTGTIGDTPYGREYGNHNVVIELDDPIKINGKKYPYVFYGGCQGGAESPLTKTGNRISKSQLIGISGRPGSKSGLVIGLSSKSNGDPRGADVATTDKLYDALYSFLQSVDKATGFIPQSSAGYDSPIDNAIPQPTANNGNPLDNPGSIATAAAFSSYFQMPGLMETREAIALTGRRSLMNDQPLLPWIEQIAGASLRSFMSMPNGNFYAFYPDYFGGLGRTAYWVINDVEIISGKIDLSDDALATHVFVVGDTTPAEGGFGHVDFIDKINSAGVVNVYNAFMADFLNGPAEGTQSTMVDSTKPSLANKDAAINFLKKYGARPIVEEVPAIRSPIYETFLAYQRFCLLWAGQFKTAFEFTFMPELYPGGLVELEGHGIQCYVDQVVHSGSYESGFTTTATLSAPAATKDSTTGKPVDPDRSWVHSGMIRAFQFDPNTPPSHPAQAYDASTPRPAPRSTGNTQ
jgi:hypothetical protein